MATAGKHGVTANTPKNIQFGAGTIHKNLAYTTNAWNFADSIIGATSGGSTLTITPEITPVEVDGALVKAKGLQVKTGETATLEVNFAELSTDLIVAATLGDEGTSSDSNYELIESKGNIATGDYLTSIAFVGETLDGRKVIAILPNALCTSGFAPNPQNKANTVNTMTFECHADLTGDLDHLPWQIYYPVATA